MRIERSALFSLALLSACVQDVDLGLGDAGSINDTSDTGTASDTGTVDDAGNITCNQAGVECVSACSMGHTPRPDLQCGPGLACCSTEATTCAGDPPQCEWCGALYPPTCVGTTWTCDDRGPCTSCNVDSECGDLSYCENNFAARVGDCNTCPFPPSNPCIGGTIKTVEYGNGCGWFECECPAGTGPIPNEGCEGPGGWLDLDPATLTFFSLPINSIRYAISGWDPDARTCVSVIWTLGGVEDAEAFCGESTPYVIIAPDQNAPCGELWDYASNVTTNSAIGCYDFADFATLGSWAPHLDLIDLDLSVTSTTFTGNIRIKNRTSQQPRPVSFTFRYSTDVPGESIYVQARDQNSKPSWVTLSADGVRLPIGDGCDVMECGDPGNCPVATRSARNIIRPSDFGGSATLTWDGYVYNTPTAATCMERQPAHPRQYTAEFCFGRSVDTSGGEEVVTNTQCQQVTFDYPTSEVVLRVDEGG
jgi:hypothetical protein